MNSQTLNNLRVALIALWMLCSFMVVVYLETKAFWAYVISGVIMLSIIKATEALIKARIGGKQ